MCKEETFVAAEDNQSLFLEQVEGTRSRAAFHAREAADFFSRGLHLYTTRPVRDIGVGSQIHDYTADSTLTRTPIPRTSGQ